MTEEQKETRVTLPKPKRPVGRPPKHGAYSGAELAILTPVKKDEIIQVLTGAKVMLGPADIVPVQMLAGCLAKMELIDRFFAACGVFNEEGGIRSNEFKVYLAAMNSATRLCSQLGMTPDSRIKLGIGMIQANKDLASMMSEAAEEEPS